MRAVLLVTAAAAASATLPAGFSTYFVNNCPSGWEEIPEAKGRVVVSVIDPTLAGITVGTPLGDRENRVHTHPFSGELDLPTKEIAAVACCDTLGSHHGSYNATGVTNTSSSGLPFTQTWLCRLIADAPTLNVPFGAVGFYDSSAPSCPTEWTTYNISSGRTVVPGYIGTGDEPVVSSDAPLAPSEDRVHAHSFSTFVQVDDISYVGVDGCCNKDPAPSGKFPLNGEAEPASANVPYIQLLTCFSEVTSFATALPADAVLFSPLTGCPTGWELADTLSGRVLVALPAGGQGGASFGGASISPNATEIPGTVHELAGELQLPVDDVGLAEGCCGDGYARSGAQAFAGVTQFAEAGFPYVMVSACVQSATAQSLRSRISSVASA